MKFQIRFYEQLICGLGLIFLLASILLSFDESVYSAWFFMLGGLILGIGIWSFTARSIE